MLCLDNLFLSFSRQDSLQPDLDINQQQQRHAAASAAHHSRSLWRWWWEQPSHRSPDSQHISLNSPASTGSGYCPALLELLAEFDCLSVEDLRHHVFTALDDKAEQEVSFYMCLFSLVTSRCLLFATTLLHC